MTTTEHLLITAAEECAEVAQRITKALRFGLDDKHPKTGSVPARELIVREFEDLLGTMDMLQARGVIRPPKRIARMVKRARVNEFLDYARHVGTLSDSDQSRDRQGASSSLESSALDVERSMFNGDSPFLDQPQTRMQTV